MGSIAEELPKEIKRVTAKKERWLSYELEGYAVSGMQLPILVIQMDIEQAVASLASGDAVEMLRSYEALKAYNDDD